MRRWRSTWAAARRPRRPRPRRLAPALAVPQPSPDSGAALQRRSDGHHGLAHPIGQLRLAFWIPWQGVCVPPSRMMGLPKRALLPCPPRLVR